MIDSDKNEISGQYMDISTLRRKLFGNNISQEIVESDEPDSPIVERAPYTSPLKTPELGFPMLQNNISDSLCSELFGELSPISNNPTPDARKKTIEDDMSIDLNHSEEDSSFEREREKDNAFGNWF